jgi:hypothetical protein
VERKIEREDITYMNIVGMIENKGYSIRDYIYCRQCDGKDVLVENNAIIYDLLHMFESSKILDSCCVMDIMHALPDAVLELVGVLH